MALNQLLNFFYSRSLVDIIFKIVAVSLSFFYLLYSFIIAKQVKIMDKSLQEKFNIIIITVCSIQTTIAFVLFIFSIFFA